MKNLSCIYKYYETDILRLMKTRVCIMTVLCCIVFRELPEPDREAEEGQGASGVSVR